MGQLFPPATNALARGTIFGGLLVVATMVWAGNEWLRSSYVTQVDVVRDQPVPFSHDHHTSGLGIDCRYCHATVETAAFAGMPTTETCMGCHSQIWKDSPLLAPVRESWRSGEPLAWTRVHDLPDFVYFNHAIHVAKGIGCESCHGRVDKMPLMRKASTLHMEWCLDCHEHPERNVREKDDLFVFGRPERERSMRNSGERTETTTTRPKGVVPTSTSTDNNQLVQEYGIVRAQLLDCVICHR
jgi:hypothetical protein